jgi:hypothetical protein
MTGNSSLIEKGRLADHTPRISSALPRQRRHNSNVITDQAGDF